jgi:hypothetical protein
MGNMDHNQQLTADLSLVLVFFSKEIVLEEFSFGSTHKWN